MSIAIQRNLAKFRDEVAVLVQVEAVVRRMVDAVELQAVRRLHDDLAQELKEFRTYTSWMMVKYKALKAEKLASDKQSLLLQQRAEDLRERAVTEIGQVLREGRRVHELREKIILLECNLSDSMEEIEGLREQMKQLSAAAAVGSSGAATSGSSSSAVVAGSMPTPSAASSIVAAASIITTGSVSTVSNVAISPKTPPVSQFVSILHELDGELMLQVFPFLDTVDVLSAAQVCKYVYARVYKLFGIDSQTILPDWSVKPIPASVVLPAQPSPSISLLPPRIDTHQSHGSHEAHSVTVQSPMSVVATPVKSVASAFSAATSAISSPFGIGSAIASATAMATATSSSLTSASAASGASLMGTAHGAATTAAPAPTAAATAAQVNALPKDFAESLSKKLTAPELKVIINMTEKVKKQSQQIETLVLEKENMADKLQSVETIKDFLVDKLHNAELALKSTMLENSSLKKQAIADQEVISYLDLRGQELEGQNIDYSRTCEQMKTTIDLQTNSYAAMEEQLNREAKEFREKLEELEASSKSQKKLLAREIRTLRTQVESLSRERNVYLTQLNTLREALSLAAITGHSLSSSNHAAGSSSSSSFVFPSLPSVSATSTSSVSAHSTNPFAMERSAPTHVPSKTYFPTETSTNPFA